MAAEGLGAVGWAGAHPLLVHLPIAWVVAAVAALAVAVLTREARSLASLRTALALLAASAVSAVLAVLSGQASAAAVALPVGAELLLARHQQLGLFLAGGVGLLALAVGGVALHPAARRRRLVLVLLLVAGTGIVALTAATAHLGGSLVHELGVRAWSLPAALPRP